MCEHVTPASIRAAAVRIRPLARRTPVLTSADFDAAAGMRVFFKCENLQTGGAFKIRGASNLILSIPERICRAEWWPSPRAITRSRWPLRRGMPARPPPS